MKQPTKKLLNLGMRYQKARVAYNRAMFDYVRSIDSMPLDLFWEYLEEFAKGLRSRMVYETGSPVQEASHNLILTISNKEAVPEEGWLKAASFLSAYRKVKNMLNAACDAMPGVGKGGDAYEDWIDALPLAGKRVCSKILHGELVTYDAVDAAVKEESLSLHKLIMDGENYIASRFEDKLVDMFVHVAVQALTEVQ
jgi:hypothetical protein